MSVQDLEHITYILKKEDGSHEKTVIRMPNGCPIVLNTSYPLTKFLNMAMTGPVESWDLTKFTNRLRTFNCGWKLPFLKPESMAKAGFYYMGKQDCVRCAFCSIEVDYWQRGALPFYEHVKLSPQCPFFANKYEFDVPEDDHTFVESRRIQTFLNSIGIVQQIQAPKHREFTALDTRLLTFSKCMIKLKQSIHTLSEAGLFYIGDGNNDQMLCFCCSRGLKDWEDNDEPWTEHARWSPNCSYVLLCKGKSFVEKACGFLCSYQELCSDKKKSIQAASILEKNFRLTKASLEKRKLNIIDPAEKKFNYEIAMSQLDTRLAIENQPTVQQQQQYSGPIPDCLLCKICFKEEIRVAFIPCGHAVSCVQCALTIEQCAICREMFSLAMRLDIHKAIEFNVEIPGSPSRHPEKALNNISCNVCHKEEMSAAFIPCRHVYACVHCATDMDECPMCNLPVCATVQIFL